MYGLSYFGANLAAKPSAALEMFVVGVPSYPEPVSIPFIADYSCDLPLPMLAVRFLGPPRTVVPIVMGD